MLHQLRLLLGFLLMLQLLLLLQLLLQLLRFEDKWAGGWSILNMRTLQSENRKQGQRGF
jgi:hypothetical protein